MYCWTTLRCLWDKALHSLLLKKNFILEIQDHIPISLWYFLFIYSSHTSILLSVHRDFLSSQLLDTAFDDLCWLFSYLKSALNSNSTSFRTWLDIRWYFFNCNIWNTSCTPNSSFSKASRYATLPTYYQWLQRVQCILDSTYLLLDIQAFLDEVLVSKTLYLLCWTLNLFPDYRHKFSIYSWPLEIDLE